MGKLKFDGVQKILHLDVEYANFTTWEEVLDFEVDGVQIKVRLDFGGGFVDWRGWQTNAGQ